MKKIFLKFYVKKHDIKKDMLIQPLHMRQLIRRALGRPRDSNSGSETGADPSPDHAEHSQNRDGGSADSGADAHGKRTAHRRGFRTSRSAWRDRHLRLIRLISAGDSCCFGQQFFASVINKQFNSSKEYYGIQHSAAWRKRRLRQTYYFFIRSR